MFEYPSLLRIPYHFIAPEFGKRYHENPLSLFNQDFIITEKLDGSQVGLSFNNGQPYAQGRSSHIFEFDKRKAFYGLWSWIWESIEKISKINGYIIFGEWLRVQHNIVYDNLPDFFIAFDVYDKKHKQFLNPLKAKELVEKFGFIYSPVIHNSKSRENTQICYSTLPLIINSKCSFNSSIFLSELNFSKDQIEQIRKKSNGEARFSDDKIFVEGFVLKSFNPKFSQVKKSIYWDNCAKLVSQVFLDEFDTDAHWTSHQIRENKLSSWKKQK